VGRDTPMRNYAKMSHHPHRFDWKNQGRMTEKKKLKRRSPARHAMTRCGAIGQNPESTVTEQSLNRKREELIGREMVAPYEKRSRFMSLQQLACLYS